jgi:hypothetical protein
MNRQTVMRKVLGIILICTGLLAATGPGGKAYTLLTGNTPRYPLTFDVRDGVALAVILAMVAVGCYFAFTRAKPPSVDPPRP